MRDGGFALLAVLGVVVAATLLSNAAWIFAHLELRVARAHRDRVVAEWAARARIAEATGAAIDSGDPPEPGAGLTATRVSDALTELRAGPGDGGWAGLVTVHDGATILSELGALVGAGVPLDSESRTRIVEDPGCPAGPVPLVGTVPPVPAAFPVSMGGWLPAELRARLPPAPGRLVLAPDPPDPAARPAPHRASEGPVRVEGTGRIVLSALRIVVEPGATAGGVLRADAEVRIRGGGRFTGAVSSGGRIVVEPGGTLVSSGCAAADALEGGPLTGARGVGPAGWPTR